MLGYVPWHVVDVSNVSVDTGSAIISLTEGKPEVTEKRISLRKCINNGNRTTKWESNLFITSMITDRIGRQEILLPINHNHFNFRKNKYT